MVEENKGDNTSEKNEESIIENDFDNAFKDEGEEDSSEDKDKGEKEEKKDNKKEDEDKEDSSAIIQKKKYREKLKTALEEINDLKRKYETKEKEGSMTDKDREEKAAKEFLANTIKDVLKESKKEQEEAEAKAEEELQDQIDEVLEKHTDIKEKQLLDVCEEFEVKPKVALKIIQEREKYKAKEKPNMPQPKRGGTDVKEEKAEKSKTKTPYESKRSIKEGLKKGTY